MNKIDQLQSALDLLKGQDVEGLKNALVLIGEGVELPATQPTQTGSPFEVGRAYFIRTVTRYQVGRVASMSDKFVVLEDAAWIADTGRFSDALKSGEFSEVEPVQGQYRIAIGAIVDFVDWSGKLPLEKK